MPFSYIEGATAVDTNTSRLRIGPLAGICGQSGVS